MAKDRRNVTIGRLQFEDEFSNPVVDVTHEFRTVDHEIIRSEARESGFAVQLLGRKPARINVEGYIHEEHTHSNGTDVNLENPTRILRTATGSTDGADTDSIRSPVYFTSERWNGAVIPETIDIAEQREQYDGKTLLDITMELREVAEDVITEDAVTPDSSTARTQQSLGYGSISRSRTDTTATAPLVRDLTDIPDALDLSSSLSPLSNTNTDRLSSTDFGFGAQTYVGRLKFAKKYSDPLVDLSVTHNFNENNLLGSQLRDRKEFQANSTGIEPPVITINGVILGQQTHDADLLGRTGMVLVSTDAWSGTAAVESVETVDRREVDPAFNDWLHDITVTLKGVAQDEVLLPATAPTGNLIEEPTMETVDVDSGTSGKKGPTDEDENPWKENTFDGPDIEGLDTTRPRFHYEFEQPSDNTAITDPLILDSAFKDWKRGEISYEELKEKARPDVILEIWFQVKDRYK